MLMRIVLAAGVALGLASCGSTQSDDDSSSNGGSGGGKQAAELFADSSCFGCLGQECKGELGDCSADASCAAYWNCLGGCGVDEGGSADPVCEAGCQRTAEASDARSALAACLWDGDGATCAACGAAPPPRTGVLSQTCGPSDDASACLKCELEHCCDTYDACRADAECLAYLDCLKACTESDFSKCETECTAAHPGGVDTWAPREACVTIECSKGGDCLDQPPNACSACVNEQCADSYVACVADPTCFRLWNCVGPCTTVECYDACEAEFPSAADALDAFVVCGTHRCNAECG